MIDHIVFDIGSVLIHYDPQIPYKKIIPNDAERVWFFANVCTSAWNIEQDGGRPWPEAEALLISKFPDHESNIKAFRKNWHHMVSHAYQDSVDIMRGLIADGRDVTMLTNFAADTFKHAQQIYPFLTETRGVTVSGEVKMLKPNAEIYHHHIKAFDLVPARTLFIDDSLPNVTAAIAAGWQAVHFTNAKALKADLERFGVTCGTGDRV